MKIIKNISPETDFIFTPNGIKIRAVATSATYMVIFKMDKKMFEEYQIEKETITTVNTDIFEKLVRKVGKKELGIEILPDAIRLSNPKEKFDLKYFVGQNDERADPNPECASVWKIQSKEFAQTITDLNNLGVICNFTGGDNLTIKMKSNIVNGQVTTDAEKIQSEDCNCFYDLTYITPIVELQNIFKELRVGFNFESPCVIKGDNEYLNFQFILAARVE